MTRQQYSRTAPPAPAARRRRQGGFLLPLMAGLIVVAGSLAAVVVMKEQRESFWEPRTGTTSDLSEVNAAIIAYQRSKNYKLPCPASLSSNTGIEECAATPPAGTQDVGTGSTVRIGALPTRTLGLPDSAGEDKWGNKLTYAVVKTHMDVFQFSNPVAAGTGINVTTAAGTQNDQAYIIISHGKDGKGATPAKATSVGIACTSSSGQDQTNCTNDQNFSALGMNIEPGANYFDDIVIFGTPDPAAQQTNKPCINGIAASWGVNNGNGVRNCSGILSTLPAAGIRDGEVSSSITNTNTGTTGSATFQCNNGTLTQQPGATCFAHCLSGPVTWLTNCSAVAPTINHGDFSNVNNTAPGYNGVSKKICNDGVLTDGTPTNCNANTVHGQCNNSVAWACSAGTAINGVDAGCGGTRTWQCQGSNGGSTASCSQSTGACAVNGACNNSVAWACSAGTAINGVDAGCGGTRTWQCQGSNGGSTASCSQSTGACAVNGCRRTSATYTGNLGGIAGANAKCAAEFPGYAFAQSAAQVAQSTILDPSDTRVGWFGNTAFINCSSWTDGTCGSCSIFGDGVSYGTSGPYLYGAFDPSSSNYIQCMLLGGSHYQCNGFESMDICSYNRPIWCCSQ